MVLESLNSLNIKRMVLETPEKTENDLPFDVERDITEEDWSGMRQGLEKDRWRVMRMKILAAEEVRVTDKGIALVMPKPKIKLKADIPPMPETKKF